MGVIFFIGVFEALQDNNSNATSHSREETQIESKVNKERESKDKSKDSKETTNKANQTDSEKYDFNSVEAILRICGLEATVETAVKYGFVDTLEGDNPYDVEWDYGNEYDEYVDACDWSLVFDANFYMDTFPMLAKQYHHDEDLLLLHFQTVGIHEGRQGTANFNVGAYASNCDSELSDTFGTNYEGYYIYYMLNYDEEKSVDTINHQDGTPTAVQYEQIFTAAQLAELEAVNEYRAELGVEPLVLDSEMSATANLRAYINAHDDYRAHDWANENKNTIYEWIGILGSNTLSENTVTIKAKSYKGNVHADDYADSEAHYKAMTAERFHYTGISNSYVGVSITSQFDVFTGTLNTPMHH